MNKEKKMKIALFASAAILAAVVAAPAFAAEGVIGTVDASYARSNVDVGSSSGDINNYGLGGSVTIPTGTNWAVKLDADYSRIDGDGADADAFGGAAHVFHNNESFLLGGFVSGGKIDDLDVDGWNVGVEGQKYLGKVTLAGNIAYGQLNVFGLDADTWAVGGEARYFISDNFRINGGLNWAKADVSGGDADAWSGNVGAEYQFASAPVSIFGGYTHSDAGDFDISSDAFKIGVRYTFGGATLIQRDRAGADLRSADAIGIVRSAF
jgi:opacity protein-like surface antigen